MRSASITLTTDFGCDGPYVASMKGVILGINPAVQLVDVSHELAAQDVHEAAFCLAQVVPHFSDGTIHIVVVDPGVGSSRRLLCVCMRKQIFLAPDNGVLSWAARGAEAVERIDLREPRFWRPDVSPTFHGRDILAPVAAHLSLGVHPRELGCLVSDWVELPWPSPTRRTDRLEGEVLAIDRFGNLVTNISRSDVESLGGQTSVRVQCGGREIGRLVRTYSDADVSMPLALLGSSGLVEIAVRNGSAAQQLACQRGTSVLVTR